MCFCLFELFMAVINCLFIHILANDLKEFCLSGLKSLIALNKPSLEKFSKDVKEGGVIIYDSRIGEFTTDKDIEVIAVPSVEIAEEHGNARTANTALLGVLMELRKSISPEAYENAIKQMFASKPKVIDVNIDVLKAGAQWMKDNS